MAKLTSAERLAVLEQKVEQLDKKLDRYFDESKEFHTELLGKLETLNNDRVGMATLKEKVKTLEKITWIALTAAGGAMVQALYDIITHGGNV